MALQALSEYAILSYVGGVNLTISLASTNLDFQETFELNRENKKLLQSAKVIASMERESITSQMSPFRLFVLVDRSLSAITYSRCALFFPRYYSD